MQLSSWREIERELVDYFRREGLRLDESTLCDKLAISGRKSINLTHLAKELWEKLR